MKLLICLATDLEKHPIEDRLKSLSEINDTWLCFCQHEIKFLVTGVGVASTTFHLASFPGIRDFDMLLQAGIGGSFESVFPVGSVVEVITERFADLGIEDKDGSFRDVFTEGLVPSDDFPFQKGVLSNSNKYTELPSAEGVTVNKVHGEAGAIQHIRSLYSPGIESMEGAAFFYAALQMGMPFCQIRAVSNMVEPRDKSKWNIAMALDRMADEVIRFLQSDLSFMKSRP